MRPCIKDFYELKTDNEKDFIRSLNETINEDTNCFVVIGRDSVDFIKALRLEGKKIYNSNRSLLFNHEAIEAKDGKGVRIFIINQPVTTKRRIRC